MLEAMILEPMLRSRMPIERPKSMPKPQIIGMSDWVRMVRSTAAEPKLEGADT